ncbi:glycine cleavage system aminomethyltransferase GcvT [Halorubrum ezzemoulense]|uniref:Probable aminomethyltransferase n=2 Tax=Halorubrum ezzemoulense TaxID=337243 RepID=A0A1X4GPX0_HALEZ|nr:glycine cleavage system aminomethyltransferase GcvT [Halorubrum ezzemoulense]MDB2237207.1 glycine cleavage system aminomethyltransferase GcvT [Halorubrum ezzemoulense]MDB2246843.1 glycine cleavage system aminomethyltransferase GcvT [Halorubrum ezzemoulense]MDB9232675.1 glycine cleavage system aminomethyltransferase GcvT [Halorubrum ezzemoulense]OSP00133.1 glycine cleavage system protein T [Halorubrum ezzemoulense DSM 17463]OYR64609.1 glycine cleavage system protein T [Halorubrum ezzemoulens
MTDRLPPLHDAHDARGAKFTDFGGWQMPVEFDSIRTEHAAVRESVGVFDVSHMGEIEVAGPDATELMNRLTTNDVRALDPGDSQYAAITNGEGVMLDDTVVYRLPDGTPAGEGAASLAALESDHGGDLDAPSGDPAYLFVPNAGHDGQMSDRWTAHRDEWGLDATVANATGDWAMLAVQGPDAADALDQATPRDRVVDLSKFEAAVAAVAGVESWVARTGYTGEDGFEVMCPAADAGAVWEAFVDAPREAQPCGLGARDTLRTEMGFLLSGQDFDPEGEPRTPYEARIGFVVKLDTEFVGRDALEVQKEQGVDEKFVGVRLSERGVPRGGYAVTDGDLTRVGKLTSGTMSPTLDEPIGLGYLHESYADAGTEVSVVVRGDEKRAEVVVPPFLDR